MNKTVSVLLVNYNGEHLLVECLDSIYRSNFPNQNLEIIIVDNNSRDGSVSLIKKKYPEIVLVESDTNHGFAKGNNLALEYATGDYIVLLNTDTTVNPDWLNHMIKAAESEKNIGIVAPKLYFSTPYLPVKISSPTLAKSEIYTDSDDFSPYGILIESVVAKYNTLERPIFFQSGFYQKEKGHIETTWTNGEGLVLVPFHGEQETISVSLHGIPTRLNDTVEVTIHTDSIIHKKVQVKSKQVAQATFSLSKSDVKKQLSWLVQNTGNCIFKNGLSRDRGALVRKTKDGLEEFYDFDSEYYNKPQKLVGLCGACCLIKREVIDSIGLFNETFFMYYEDVDFGLKAWKMGWDIQYEPKAVVYHKHRSTTDTSQKQMFFQTMVKKNYLIFLLLHFSLFSFIITLIKTLTLAFVYNVLFFIMQFLNYYGRYYKNINQRKHVYTEVLTQLSTHSKKIYSERIELLKKQKRSQNQAQKYFY